MTDGSVSVPWRGKIRKNAVLRWLGFRVSDLGFWVWGFRVLGFRVLGFWGSPLPHKQHWSAWEGPKRKLPGEAAGSLAGLEMTAMWLSSLNL